MASPKQVDMRRLIVPLLNLTLILASIPTRHNALPLSESTLGAANSEIAAHKEIDLNSNYYNQDQSGNHHNCLSHSEKLEDCKDELSGGQLPAKVIICLNNCAHCVKQWRTGVYNGRSCALDCVQQVENLSESLDPDCSLVKYFNSTILASVI